jgi:hypothetical protein
MTHLSRRTIVKAMPLLGVAGARAERPAEWTDPVEVRHEENLCLSYRARLEGSLLIVRATIESPWHTFAMDNKQRALEKLGGKKSLGIDRPTEISLTGLEQVGPWYQSTPKDFSRPQLRWFSWGFERQALFATKIHRSGAASARIAVRGQACTDTTCKNIDVAILVPLAEAKTDADSSGFSLKELIQVRAGEP